MVQVKLAMNEINAAKRMRVATQEKAEAEKMLVVKVSIAITQSVPWAKRADHVHTGHERACCLANLARFR